MLKIKFDKINNKAIALDENKIIGECNYLINGKEWNIIHTIVNDSYRGKKIAKKLVYKIIEESKKENINLTADCTYAKQIISKF